MLVPPKRWDNKKTRDGCYFRLKSTIVRSNSRMQIEAVRRANIGPVLEGLDYLGQVPCLAHQLIMHDIPPFNTHTHHLTDLSAHHFTHLVSHIFTHHLPHPFTYLPTHPHCRCLGASICPCWRSSRRRGSVEYKSAICPAQVAFVFSSYFVLISTKTLRKCK